MSEQQLAEAFVELADTLVDDFDVVDFLHELTVRCAQVLGVTAAGVLLTDQRGALRVVAASTEQTRLLELLQSQTDQGPCPERAAMKSTPIRPTQPREPSSRPTASPCRARSAA